MDDAGEERSHDPVSIYAESDTSDEEVTVVCVCVHACVHVCACVCMCVCACVCIVTQTLKHKHNTIIPICIYLVVLITPVLNKVTLAMQDQKVKQGVKSARFINRQKLVCYSISATVV